MGLRKPLCIWQWPLAQLIFGIRAQSYYDPPIMTGDQGVRNLTAIINRTVQLPNRYSSEFPTCPPSFEISDISKKYNGLMPTNIPTGFFLLLLPYHDTSVVLKA